MAMHSLFRENEGGQGGSSGKKQEEGRKGARRQKAIRHAVRQLPANSEVKKTRPGDAVGASGVGSQVDLGMLCRGVWKGEQQGGGGRRCEAGVWERR